MGSNPFEAPKFLDSSQSPISPWDRVENESSLKMTISAS